MSTQITNLSSKKIFPNSLITLLRHIYKNEQRLNLALNILLEAKMNNIKVNQQYKLIKRLNAYPVPYYQVKKILVDLGFLTKITDSAERGLGKIFVLSIKGTEGRFNNWKDFVQQDIRTVYEKMVSVELTPPSEVKEILTI